jgi:uncharacterized protein YecT (DUF1311 family)
MRTSLTLAASFFRTLTFAAHAQKAPADAQTIAACLKKAEDQGTFGGNCIGLIADPCMTATKEKPNYWENSKACAARELTVWTALMTEALKRANAGAEQRMKTALAETQKAFAESRDKLCPVFDKLDPGMVPGGANYCRLQETARRVLNLRRLADAVNEH